jgi:hypothetical protein
MGEKLVKLEPLSLDNSKKLIGGFSNVYSVASDERSDVANNCKGGNCKEGCNNHGNKKKKLNKPIPNGNCGAGKNCVKGCGG